MRSNRLLKKHNIARCHDELVSASIGNLRKLIKTELADEIKEIDRIVKGILKI